MQNVMIPLNDTIVVCLAGDGAQGALPRVVQITCKAERPEDVKTIGTYYLVRHELSELILRVAGAHLGSPLPSSLVFTGERYTLVANHAPWTFGKKVDFMLGDDVLEVCADKWTFIFSIDRGEPLFSKYSCSY
ncbi:hypothetical protein C2E23DRAFT_739739 [Lenzites betulinus]|nr:hypothetical protein C2E23DRAFT_739739 [Lenzites betulinus]